MYKTYLHASVRVKALLSLDYFHDWNLSTYYRYSLNLSTYYSSSLIYYAMFQINIYKNFYIVSDADNFKKLSLVIL